MEIIRQLRRRRMTEIPEFEKECLNKAVKILSKYFKGVKLFLGDGITIRFDVNQNYNVEKVGEELTLVYVWDEKNDG